MTSYAKLRKKYGGKQHVCLPPPFVTKTWKEKDFIAWNNIDFYLPNIGNRLLNVKFIKKVKWKVLKKI